MWLCISIVLREFPPITVKAHAMGRSDPKSWTLRLVCLRRPARTPQPQDGRDQEEDAVAQVRDGRALQDHRRLRGGHQGGCRQG